MGVVGWGQLDPRLEAEMEVMRAGEVRGPIETDQGWNVILLEATVPWKERPELARLRNRIAMTLSQRALSRRSLEFFEELRSEWKVQVFEEALIEGNVLGGSKSGLEADPAQKAVVARAGGRTITLADLRARVDLEAVGKLPRPWALRQVRKILDDLTFELLLEQEALRRGYGRKPAVLAEADRLEEGMLLDRLMTTAVYPRIQITDDEVRAFYDQNPKPFTEPAAVRVAVIVLESDQDAEEVLGEARRGAEFAALARTRSKDPLTAQAGGEVGWVVKGRTNPVVEAMIFSMKVGEVGVAATEKAKFVVKIEEQRLERVEEFGAVKDKARQMLLAQRRRDEARRWIIRLREASEIVVEDAAIGKAVAGFKERLMERAGAAGKSDGDEGKAKDHP